MWGSHARVGERQRGWGAHSGSPDSATPRPSPVSPGAGSVGRGADRSTPRPAGGLGSQQSEGLSQRPHLHSKAHFPCVPALKSLWGLEPGPGHKQGQCYGLDRVSANFLLWGPNPLI